MTIIEAAKPILKSITAFVAMWLVALVAKIGLNLEVEEVEILLGALVNAFLVWLVPNLNRGAA